MPGQRGLGMAGAKAAGGIRHRFAHQPHRLWPAALARRQVAEQGAGIGPGLGAFGVGPPASVMRRAGQRLGAGQVIGGQRPVGQLHPGLVARRLVFWRMGVQQRGGFGERGLRLRVVAKALKHPAQRAQHLAQQQRLAGKPVMGAAQAACHHLPAGHFSAGLRFIGLGRLHHVQHELANRVGPALLVGGAGVLQPQQAGQQQRRHAADGTGRSSMAVAPHKKLQAPAWRRRPGGNGPVVKVAGDVVGHAFSRAVTLGRCGAQRLQHDGVQIARQLGAQRSGMGGATPGRHAAAQRRLAGWQRRVVQHGLHRVRHRALGLGMRQRAGQQLIQQHAEAINIGGGGDRPAVDLLGRSVARRQHIAAVARQRAGGSRTGRRLQQLGNAEIEQFDLALPVHKHVGRFDVAMHHQVAVGMGHGGQHLQKNPQPGGNSHLRRIAGVGDGPAGHEFHHQIGLARQRHTGVVEPGDLRVVEPAQHLPLLLEAQDLAGRPPMQQRHLERHAAAGRCIRPLGQPDAAHAALAQQALQAIRADQITGLGGGLGGAAVSPARAVGHEGGMLARLLRRQHLGQQRPPGLGRRRQCRQPGRPGTRRQIKRLVQQAAEGRQIGGGEVRGRGHGLRRPGAQGLAGAGLGGC